MAVTGAILPGIPALPFLEVMAFVCFRGAIGRLDDPEVALGIPPLA